MRIDYTVEIDGRKVHVRHRIESAGKAVESQENSVSATNGMAESGAHLATSYEDPVIPANVNLDEGSGEPWETGPGGEPPGGGTTIIFGPVTVTCCCCRCGCAGPDKPENS